MREFDEIYSEYFSEVYKFSLSLCRDPSLAEEITQEAFFRALKGIESFNGSCRISSWLCAIAKNVFYSRAKSCKANQPYSFDVADPGQSIEERFVDKETAYAVHKILHRLKEPYKEVFWLKTFGELSFAQIASLFGKTESWARVTYYRAKISIREELK